MNIVGQRIKNRRIELNLSQDELAAKAGISQRQVSRYERGESDLTGQVLIQMADALGTSADFLLGRTNFSDDDFDTTDLDAWEIEIIRMLRTVDRERRQKIANAVKALV